MTRKLSIIIPTRNRPQFLMASVRTIRRVIPEAEIVIADNSDSPQLDEDLRTYVKDGSVRYLYSPEILSVVENFERAYLASTGEYLMFLGDDDSVGPGLALVLDWAWRNQIEAVVSYGNYFLASYYWPGVRAKYYGDSYSAKLFIREFTGRAWQLDGPKEVRRVATKFGGGLGCMPRAYHGLVSKALLDRVRTKYGAVFGGLSPDIYSATLISAEATRAYLVDYPFVIPGGSAPSTAGQGAARSDRGELRSTEHVSRFGNSLVWDPRIPEFYSPFTVWAYSLLKGLEKVPNLDIDPSFPRLYAKCYLHCRQQSKIIAKSVDVWISSQSTLMGWIRLAGGFLAEMNDTLGWLIKKLLHPRAGGPAVSVGGLQDIGAAYKALECHLDKAGIELHLQDLQIIG